jgi:hypothetical protein
MTKIGKSKVLMLCVVVTIALFLIPSIALATMTNSVRSTGPVTGCGERVPDGTPVSAWLEDPYVGPWNTTIQTHYGTSWYVIDIPADDPKTPKKDGAVDGDEVHFSVLGFGPPGETGKWVRGGYPPGSGYVYQPLRLPCCIPGDANGDGVVDTGDITKVKRIIMEFDDPTPCADANQDGVIDTGDITKIKLIIMGIDC